MSRLPYSTLADTLLKASDLDPWASINGLALLQRQGGGTPGRRDWTEISEWKTLITERGGGVGGKNHH